MRFLRAREGRLRSNEFSLTQRRFLRANEGRLRVNEGFLRINEDSSDRTKVSSNQQRYRSIQRISPRLNEGFLESANIPPGPFESLPAISELRSCQGKHIIVLRCHAAVRLHLRRCVEKKYACIYPAFYRLTKRVGSGRSTLRESRFSGFFSMNFRICPL